MPHRVFRKRDNFGWKSYSSWGGVIFLFFFWKFSLAKIHFTVIIFGY